jgi:hypothetical protein
MSELAEALRAKLPQGVRLRDWFDLGVMNIVGDGRELAKADVDALRAALDEAGYRELESWVAREGASWLSDGIPSVSIRITEK